ELLYGIRAVTTAETTFTWVDDLDFLAEMRVRPYAEMPAWRPPTPGNEG
ncbi:MAG: NAD-dependent dehydratase, partial [Gemmatimonadetes bacterium]|nr:NAD-dependent dehydratase [Gemmatimonadota bacterium]NIU79530.1 NAD-dependent dehydratase [Gammaproteobacteria bacterium]NIR79079.1 NAD-dependent dehydratase [Gemmatimonadota bacterium]NIU31598.1 NAD-dependent dehydratase [Gemmatimonadota bacterium]NIV61942.1 NAD-dependent dehydratase [Gemmatimonadota bacterium]